MLQVKRFKLIIAASSPMFPVKLVRCRRGSFLLELHFTNDAIVVHEVLLYIDFQRNCTLSISSFFILGLSSPYNEARTELE